MSNKVKWVDDLPDNKKPSYDWLLDQLRANPGRWAEWPGAASGVYNAVHQHSRNGEQFEARQRNGKAYIRKVAS